MCGRVTGLLQPPIRRGSNLNRGIGSETVFLTTGGASAPPVLHPEGRMIESVFMDEHGQTVENWKIPTTLLVGDEIAIRGKIYRIKSRLFTLSNPLYCRYRVELA